jgi:hypothetical protein
MLVLILAACSPDPAKIASRYVDALDAGKIDEAYAMLCASDRRTRPIDAFRKTFDEPIDAAIARKTTVTSTKVVADGEASLVTVSVSRPDTDPQLERIHKMDVGEWAAAQAQLVADIEAGKVATHPDHVTKRVRTEEGAACVYENYEAADRVTALMKEAWKLQDAHDYAAAKVKFDAAIAANTDPDRVAPLAEVAKYAANQAAEAAVNDAYIAAHMTFSGLGIERMCSSCKRQIHGEVKNDGDRSVKFVKIALYGLDSDHKPVFDVEDMPVFAEATGDTEGR